MSVKANSPWQNRQSLISDWTRHHSALDLSGAPITTFAAVVKEGDMELLFLPSCIPRAARLRRFCLVVRYFSRSIPATPIVANLIINRSVNCDLVPATPEAVADVSAAFTNDAFAMNCYCGDISGSFDQCDVFLPDIVPTGPSFPQSAVFRLTTDWELL